jgi:hypothetical protein
VMKERRGEIQARETKHEKGDRLTSSRNTELGCDLLIVVKIG